MTLFCLWNNQDVVENQFALSRRTPLNYRNSLLGKSSFEDGHGFISVSLALAAEKMMDKFSYLLLFLLRVLSISFQHRRILEPKCDC